jgi:DNA-binding transcriptional ArsR family regulator
VTKLRNTMPDHDITILQNIDAWVRCVMTDELHEFKARYFKALGHPLRLSVLDALRDGEKSVSALQEELDVEQSTLSQQLGVLRTRGFVTSRKAGALTLYRASDPEVYAFLDIGRRLFERHLQVSQGILETLRAGDGGGSVGGSGGE